MEVGDPRQVGYPSCPYTLSHFDDVYILHLYITSPIWGPPPPCKQALIFPKAIEPVQMMCSTPQSVLHMAGHKLSNFIGTNESFYIGKRLTPTGLIKNSNMAATFHCFETPIWWTCLVKTPYTYTFTSLVCHGVGQGGSFTTRALEVGFFRLRGSFARATSYAGYSSPGL